ncbi:MAG TPA: redoxin domain-containing protein [Candidatus Limnocylindria bacterium]|nr:redoxin domain-containing protein [Candidatus Limnocylindria bacterium]
MASLAVAGLGLLCQPVGADAPGPQLGEPAPDFALTTIDGRPVRLADYRGKTLVINVWGSWCPPCRIETPDLADAARRDPRRVAFLGVDTTESASVVRAFVAAKGVPYPQIAIPATSAFVRTYAIEAYPTTFVIDPRGVLRARHADNVLPAAQLRAYVAAAQRGESAPLVSAFQRQLDALLDPARYAFTGGAPAVRTQVARAEAAIAQSDALLEDAMDDPSRDHDLIATQAEQERLRAAAIAALAPVATDADQVTLARLRGDEAVSFAAWAQADASYAAALRLAPDDPGALGGDAYAAAELGDDARVVQLREELVRLHPSAPGYVALGRALAKLHRIDAAEDAFTRAVSSAQADAARLAWTNLYFARMEVDAGNAAKARAAFAAAGSAAARIASGDPRAVWYLEQAQEGTVALDVDRGATLGLSLAPWTGPDLPGSVTSTIKYRLVVTGAAGATVVLAASGLPAHWIGSFCSDRVCAPFRTELVLPPEGVKVVEFQVVPTTPARGPIAFRIAGHSRGRSVTTGATIAHP